MNLFDKKRWLNFFIALLGFSFFYPLSALITGTFDPQAITAATTLTTSYHWILNLLLTLILSLILVMFFCKPRAPFFVAVAVLLGGGYSLRRTLIPAVAHLDGNLRENGLAALQTFLPHLVLLICAIIAFYIIWLSNRAARN